MLVVLIAVLGALFRNLFLPGQIVFSNDGPLGRRLAQNNVSGIITDYVAEMKEALLNGKEFSIDFNLKKKYIEYLSEENSNYKKITLEEYIKSYLSSLNSYSQKD